MVPAILAKRNLVQYYLLQSKIQREHRLFHERNGQCKNIAIYLQNLQTNFIFLFIIKAINGYFSISHAFWAQDDAIMQENKTVAEWKRSYHEKASNITSDYAGFAYDAVWTYALALDKLIKHDPEALTDLHSENATK